MVIIPFREWLRLVTRRMTLLVVLLLLATTAHAQPAFPVSPSPVLGEQRALVVLLKTTTTRPSEDAAKVVSANGSLAQMAAHLDQQSLGQVRFSGDVVGPILVNFTISTTSCNTASIAGPARAALDAAGIEWRSYAQPSGGGVFWVSPGKGACLGHYRFLNQREAVMFGFGAQWADWVWFEQRLSRDYNIECGTALVLNTPSGSGCDRGYASASGAMYPGGNGNPYSAFGEEGRHSTLSLANRRRLGWFSQPGGPFVQQVTASGTYTIAASNVPSDGRPQGLQIYTGLDWLGRPRWLHIDHRLPIGNDEWMLSTTVTSVVRTINGVLLTWDGPIGYILSGNLFLDTRPATKTPYDGAMVAGDKWTLPPTGPTITVVSVGDNESVVDVVFP